MSTTGIASVPQVNTAATQNPSTALAALRARQQAAQGGTQAGTATTTGAQPTATNTGSSGGSATDPLQPSYVNPNTFGPQATLKQILQGYVPAQRQQDAALNSDLAAAGIVGGGAQSAQQLLAGQQTSAIAPTLASAIQGSQGMQLSAEQGNQQAANAAKSQLANYLMQGWEVPYEAQAGIYNTELGAAGNLSGSEAQNFAVPPQSNLLNLWGLI